MIMGTNNTNDDKKRTTHIDDYNQNRKLFKIINYDIIWLQYLPTTRRTRGGIEHNMLICLIILDTTMARSLADGYFLPNTIIFEFHPEYNGWRIRKGQQRCLSEIHLYVQHILWKFFFLLLLKPLNNIVLW